MDRHGDNAPDRPGNQRDTSFAVIGHVATVAMKLQSSTWIFVRISRYRTNRRYLSRNADREKQKDQRSAGQEPLEDRPPYSSHSKFARRCAGRAFAGK